MTKFNWLAVSMLALILGACGGQTIPDPEPTSDPVAAEDEDFWGDEEDRGLSGSELDSDLVEELAMIIYFDFDQSEIRPSDQATLAEHANRLANNPGQAVRLEGHADERGSREYNIGLGERRSQAVRRILLVQGAGSDQISTVSFGEERPASLGSGEGDYAQNRRVEIRYTN